MYISAQVYEDVPNKASGQQYLQIHQEPHHCQHAPKNPRRLEAIFHRNIDIQHNGIFSK